MRFTPIRRKRSTTLARSPLDAHDLDCVNQTNGIVRRHQGRRLRASARAQRLLAARRGADDRDAGEARQGRRHAGARHHRHQQPLRCARILGKAREGGRSTDRRNAGDDRFRRRSAVLLPPRRAAPDARLHRAPRPERDRLSPSDAARLEPLARSEGGRRAACPVRLPGRLRGAHRPDRRACRADRPRARPAHGRSGREPAPPARVGFRPAPLCRASAARNRIRGRDRTGAHRSRRPVRSTAGCDQRTLFRRPLRLRGA